MPSLSALRSFRRTYAYLPTRHSCSHLQLVCCPCRNRLGRKRCIAKRCGNVVQTGEQPPLKNRAGTCQTLGMPLIDLQERDVDKWTLRLVIERGALAFECRIASNQTLRRNRHLCTLNRDRS